MSNWKEDKGKLQKVFKFEDFAKALEFVNNVGAIAESEQHHPDITLRNYSEVFISTTTHEKGDSITEKDKKLASLIDEL